MTEPDDTQHCCTLYSPASGEVAPLSGSITIFDSCKVSCKLMYMHIFLMLVLTLQCVLLPHGPLALMGKHIHWKLLNTTDMDIAKVPSSFQGPDISAAADFARGSGNSAALPSCFVGSGWPFGIT